MNEEWNVIKDYPNYEISNLGNVKSIKTGKPLKPDKKRVETLGRVYLTNSQGRRTLGISTLLQGNWEWEWIKEIEDGEEFKKCYGFPDYYISNRGRVFSTITYSFLNPYHSHHYYYYVRIGGKKCSPPPLHTLVGRTFLDYKEGDLILHNVETLPFPVINWVDNLHIGDYSMNNKETIEKERMPKGLGNHPLHKLNLEKVKEIKKLINTGYSNQEIAPLFGVTHQCVNRIKKGINWKEVEV